MVIFIRFTFFYIKVLSPFLEIEITIFTNNRKIKRYFVQLIQFFRQKSFSTQNFNIKNVSFEKIRDTTQIVLDFVKVKFYVPPFFS